MNRKIWLFIVLALAILLLAGCTAGPNAMVDQPAPDGEVAGFWLGLWQGFIAPITFIISLFNDSIAIYEVHNTGGWYDFGFLLGASIFFGGGHRGSKYGRRKRKEI